MSLLDRSAQAAASHPAPVAAVSAHFHLPDLCRITALLPLILVGELLAVALTVATQRPPAFDWAYFSLVSAEILWIVLIGALLLCRLRSLLPRLSPATGVALCFAVLLLVIAVVAAAGQWLLANLSPDWQQVVWVVLQHQAVGGIIAGLALRYFYLQQQLHLQQQAQLQALMQARFQSLQSRIRPHFLFNSMNIIASLIDSDPATAERVVEDMSALFRASLSDADNVVSLAQEISLCERYIAIEQLRLGERLQVNWHRALQHEQWPVPSLCLQPLVENAIYHGIQPLVQGGVIDIALTDSDQCLHVTISNPHDPDMQVSHKRSNGMALDNLEQRLRARYGSAAGFTIDRQPLQFIVSFSIPLETPGAQQGRSP